MRFKYLFLIFFLSASFSYSDEIAKNVKVIDEYKIAGKKNFLLDYKNILNDNTVNVVIEIPKDTNEKWEVSKIDGTIEQEFFMGSPRIIKYGLYPVNYGMIPRTVLPINLGGDGDPLDAIVLGKKIPRGMVVEAKILGLLSMKDMGEVDDKIITVHKDSKFFKYNSINDLQESNPDILKKIIEWFLNYKGKSVVQFRGLDTNLKAIELIKFASKSFERYGVRSR